MVGPYGHPGQVVAQNVFNTEGEPVPILNHPREVHTAMELIYKVKIVLMDSVKVRSGGTLGIRNWCSQYVGRNVSEMSR